MSSGLPEKPTLVFRLNDNGQGPELLQQVFLEQGWTEYDEEVHEEHEWNMWWRTSRFRTGEYENIYPWQRLNHYPKSTAITKKDALARNLKRMRCVHGSNVFNFSPLSFNLPNDYTKFVKTYVTLRQKLEGRVPLWICKPADLSRGRGIFIFRDLSELLYNCNTVIQQYIDNPLLIGGYKFDLRIYVAVTSFHPLTVYIYEEGMARFSTEKFDLNSTKNIFAHLTNTSINKHSPGYMMDKERIGPGCKWTLTQLRHYFLADNINDRMLWQRITNIVVLTLLIQASQVPKTDNCFELYGFDILVDENLKPWLLEVNFSPSLSSDCLADVLSKKPMLHDLLYLMNYSGHDVEWGGPNFRKNHKRRRHQRGFVYSNLSSHAHSRRNSHGELGVVNRHEISSSVNGFLPKLHGERDKNDKSAMGLPLAEPTFIEEEMADEYIAGLGYQSSTDVTPKISLSQNVLSPSRRNSLNPSLPHQWSVDDTFDQIINRDVTKRDGSFDLSASPGVNGLEKKSSKTTVSAESKFSVGSSERKAFVTSGESKLSKISPDSGISSLNAYSGSRSETDPLSHPISFSRNKNSSSAHRGHYNTDNHHSNQLTPLPLVEKSGKGRSVGTRSKSTILMARSESQLSMWRNPNTGAKSGLVSLGSAQYHSRDNKDNQPMTTCSNFSVKYGPSSAQRRRQTGSNISGLSVTKGSRSSRLPYGNSQRTQQVRSHLGSSESGLANLRKKVGSFYLVFPFNEATWKTAQSNLDAKIVIRETQGLLKESLTAVSGSKNTPSHDDQDNTEVLWGPIRHAE